MLLAHKRVEYTDKVVTFAEWPAVKATMPAGQMPLYVDANGKAMNQFSAIMRYLGRQHGYYPTDNIDEAFNVDWALETQADFWNTKVYRMWIGRPKGAE